MYQIKTGMSQEETRHYLERLANVEHRQMLQRQELQQRRAEAQEYIRRQIEIEREQIRLEREQAERERAWTKRQEAIEKEQARLAREQEKQAEILRKHEQRIADLEFRMTQAEADIEHWSEQIGNLYALLDIEQAEQAASVPGSKADVQHQKRIITLSNQIHSAESKLAKAKHIKVTTQKQLAA